MIRRVIRVVFRIASWLLTPLVVALAAALGATTAAIAAPMFSTTLAIVVVALVGLVSAGLGLILWLRLLRGSPELRQALAVTPQGTPLESEVDLILGTQADRASEVES